MARKTAVKTAEKKRELVLVTGGTGRLGRLLVKELLRQGKSVRLLLRDKLFASDLFGGPVPGRLEFFEADLETDRQAGQEELAMAMDGVDKVVHLAALLDYGAPKKRLFKVNAEASGKLARAAKKAGVKKFVYAGSIAVYRKPVYLPIDEKHAFTPWNAYGESKLAGEKQIVASGVPYVVLRLSIIYGRDFQEGFGQVIDAVRKGKMRIIGSGDNKISFVHASDAVDAFVKALESKARNEAFIIEGESRTQKECYKAVANALGVPVPHKKIHLMIALAAAHLEEAKAWLTGEKPKIRREYVHTLADDRWFSSEKARKKLGWTPKVRLEQGLKEMVAAKG